MTVVPSLLYCSREDGTEGVKNSYAPISGNEPWGTVVPT